MAELNSATLTDLRETLTALRTPLLDHGVEIDAGSVLKYDHANLTFKVLWDEGEDEYVAYDVAGDAPGE